VVGPASNLVERIAPFRTLDSIQTSWLERMVTTVAPLIERMTLMLHDHFATAYSPGDYIDASELIAQNKLLRQHALGNWKDVLHALLEDVAMGMWLDADRNYVGAPNENLARELMELFTLGVDGGYTETTVREAARALTGYFLDNNLDPLGPRFKMTFDPYRHDDGIKEIFNATGKLMPHDVIDILLAQPAASRHLARRLITTFVTPTPTTAFVEQIAGVLRNPSNSWELKPAMSAIFHSDEFTIENRNTLVRSPAEFIAAAWRALGVTDYATGNYWMRRAGQGLYDPPNVGGWVPNEGWLSAGLLLARYNAGVQLGSLSQNQLRLPGSLVMHATNAMQWAEIFGMTELAPATAAAVDSYIASSNAAGTADA
ncbi:MAG: DUF1800 family protein, partial [Actinomycetota bacterium]